MGQTGGLNFGHAPEEELVVVELGREDRAAMIKAVVRAVVCKWFC